MSNYQAQHCTHKVNGVWVTGWQVVTKSGIYVGTVANSRDIPALLQAVRS